MYMPREKQPSRISTMHSLGHRIIVSNLDSVGLSSTFRLLDSGLRRQLLFEDAAQLVGFTRERGREASDLKQKSIPLKQDDELYPIGKQYDAILRACNTIDFDDQIILACQLLINIPDLLSEYQRRARHLLIDEYQDLNYAQFQLIKLLTGGNAEGLFAVGDDDQSIYSFRGGSPQYVRKFQEHFGNQAKVRSIPLCRRCPPAVLKGALALVEAFNPERSLQKLNPELLNQSQSPILVHDFPSQEKEAEVIATICSKVTPSHDVLILVPNLNFARPILTALGQQRVGYDCRSVIAEEGLVALDTLGDWLRDPAESFALRECIKFLLEGARFSVPSSRVKKPEKKAAREKLLSEVSSLWVKVIKENCSLYDSLKADAAKSSLLSELVQCLDEIRSTYESPPDNFLEVIGRIIQPWRKPSEMFQEISTWINEVRGRYGSAQGSVRIMSMRMAKGLEADYVFVIGMDEQIFPRQNLGTEELQEASRLLFVSMTRATAELHLCHARLRRAAVTYLPDSFALKQSPFIKAIPKEFVKVNFVAAASTAQKGNVKARRGIAKGT